MSHSTAKQGIYKSHGTLLIWIRIPINLLFRNVSCVCRKWAQFIKVKENKKNIRDDLKRTEKKHF